VDEDKILSSGFDSVLCMGTVDWWYHNRGHFDLQILKRFARKVPVLYVNSIGMRLPKPGGGNFFGKVFRKLKSFSKGLTKVDDNFWVYSPVNFPGFSSGMPSSMKFLELQIKLVMKRVGLENPLYWVGPPSAYQVVKTLPSAPVVYQCTDRYEFYPGVDKRRISELNDILLKEADVSVFCSEFLYDLYGGRCKNSVMIDHGVDYDLFSAADSMPEPEDLKDIKRPRVGFVGSMNRGVFDPDFFLEVVRNAPDVEFVMVGNSSLEEGWCRYGNVHFLGKKDLEQVPAYMAACDVLAMYWSANEWIEACNPIKTKEYLAVGRPVVSTPFYELKSYPGLVRQAGTPAEFAEAISNYKEWAVGPQAGRDKVKDITWDAQAEKLFAFVSSVLSGS